MAYDLAIGLVKGICSTNLTLLQNWRHYADWHSAANDDSNTVKKITTSMLRKIQNIQSISLKKV